VKVSLDLSSKLALVLLLWICAFTLPWIIHAALCILLIGAHFAIPEFRSISKRSADTFNRFIVYSVVVAFFVISLNSALIKGGGTVTSLFGLSFYEEGLLFGLKTASRLILLSFSILVFFASTPIKVLISYLQEKGLPPSLVLVLLLTLHFLDLLPSRIHQIFLAQQARGAPVDAGILSRTKALLSILSPLVLSSIVESIDRGTALELRGFLGNRPIHDLKQPQVKQINILAVFFHVLSIILVFVSAYRWLNS
jgi:energy-coupling factor transporter transmembrane protein EcfT